LTSSPDEQPAESAPQEEPALAPDDALPPVEPPNAGFILQLFVIPAMIVTVIVMVWLLFGWLARGTDDLGHLIKTLRVHSEARFQAAYQLASALRNPRHAAFRADEEAAGELAAILAEEIEAANENERIVNLRIFLCRALGEFQVDAGLDVLVEAASTRRSDEEIPVQIAALDAIAVRAAYHGSAGTLATMEKPALIETLCRLAADPQDLVRSHTAFALGLFTDPRLVQQLEALLADPYPDTRYNAAIGLAAHHGSTAGLAVLEEMLDPDETAGLKIEKDAPARELKQVRIMINALRAVEQLVAKNPQADVAPLLPAIRRLARADEVNQAVRIHAASTLEHLNASAGQ